MIITAALLLYKFLKRFPLAAVFIYMVPFCVNAQAQQYSQDQQESVENLELEHTHESNLLHSITPCGHHTHQTNRFNFCIGPKTLVAGYIKTNFQKLYLLYQTSCGFKESV